MDRSRFAIAMVAVAVFTLATAGTAFAEPTAHVNGEVGVEQYALTVDSGASQDYGELDAGDTGYDIYANNVVVRNIGSDTSDWVITGSDAWDGSSALEWELDTLRPGVDQYMWKFYNLDESIGYWVDDTASSTIADNVASGSSRNLRTYIRMPTSTTGVGTYYMQATIWAVAP